ncbi:MAG: DUF488 domain-containing protein [Nitrososphaerales archaeon]
MIKTEKSIYDKPEKSDGERILVMRYWPRGISKDKIDLWMKELGTDKDLIKKWKSGKITWNEFKKWYKKELGGKQDLLTDLANRSKRGDITLLCTDKDAEHCHRTILGEEIEKIVGQ